MGFSRGLLLCDVWLCLENVWEKTRKGANALLSCLALFVSVNREGGMFVEIGLQSS